MYNMLDGANSFCLSPAFVDTITHILLRGRSKAKLSLPSPTYIDVNTSFDYWCYMSNHKLYQLIFQHPYAICHIGPFHVRYCTGHMWSFQEPPLSPIHFNTKQHLLWPTPQRQLKVTLVSCGCHTN